MPVFMPYANIPSTSKLGDRKLYLDSWRLWLAMVETGFHSAVTINARLQQIGIALATGGAFPHAEVWRMTSEKPTAAMDSFFAAWRANAMLATDAPALMRAATAGLKPYTKKSRSNARRLSK
jgi:hypothetical protein